MPDEVGTEATRSDAPSADDSLFGEAADDSEAAVDLKSRTPTSETDTRRRRVPTTPVSRTLGDDTEARPRT